MLPSIVVISFYQNYNTRKGRYGNHEESQNDVSSLTPIRERRLLVEVWTKEEGKEKVYPC